MNDEFHAMLNQILEQIEIPDIPEIPISLKGMSRKEKDQLILELQKNVLALEGKLMIVKSVYNKFTNGLIETHHRTESELLSNPILTFPSGKQLQFSSLNSEQLEYLESLASKQL